MGCTGSRAQKNKVHAPVAPQAAPQGRNYAIRALLARTTYAHVYLVTDQEQQLFALKEQRRKANLAISEAVILRILQHPNIIKLYGDFQQQSCHYLILEYLGAADLRVLINKHQLQPLEALHIMTQLCAAMLYAHRHQITHQDLKPENLFYQRRTQRLVVIDWGLALVLPTRKLTPAGTVGWAAPEVMRPPFYIDYTNDVWSIAAIFYTLLTYRHPFQDAVDSGVHAELVTAVCNFAIDLTFVPAPYRSLLQRALVPYPRRISLSDFAQALQKFPTP